MSQLKLIYKTRTGRVERTRLLGETTEPADEALAALSSLHQQIAASGRLDYVRPVRVEPVPEAE